MPRIEIIGVSHTYKNRKGNQSSLNDISCVFLSNSNNVILGASGGGKTTLLRCIMGFENYDGYIKLDGRDISVLPFEERNISYVNQDIALYPNMNIFNNIAFPLVNRKIDKDEIRNRVLEIAEDFSLTKLLFRKPKELSIGECQRVAIAKALIKRPSLILLDEPFSNLDKETSLKISSFVNSYLKKHSITSIYITHNFEEALRFADNIFIIESGKIIASGRPLEVYNNKDPMVHKYFIK